WSFVNFEKVHIRVSFQRNNLNLNESVDICDHHEFTRDIGNWKTGSENIFAFFDVNCSTIPWNKINTRSSTKEWQFLIVTILVNPLRSRRFG
ncbi:hypothetical protein PFISCL1PPCAC_17693, partial [Pristionchus fissidentatus]